MCAPLLPLAIGGLMAGASIYSASKQASAQRKAQEAASADAAAQAQRAETQFNAANKKQPGLAALFSANKNANSKGAGSTFLTGPAGVPDLAKYLGGAPALLGGK